MKSAALSPDTVSLKLKLYVRSVELVIDFEVVKLKTDGGIT